MTHSQALKRDDSRIIIHFDYDCFYASVVEAENPALKYVPLAIQQKQIVVTCNYEARRRGLYKLQLIREAKRVCPDVVVVLGEDLTRFRDASKMLYGFLQEQIWSKKAERLGFDEVFFDCTDMIDYNMDILNSNDLPNFFFCLDRNDPTVGFTCDATIPFGPTFPATCATVLAEDQGLYQRLVLGSHLARHLRHQLEVEKGYTATVGISTNKLLSKLVGNVNKPRNQTTLVPPYQQRSTGQSNVTSFMDDHDIGKVPGIGFKLSQKIRGRVLGRQPAFQEGLVYGGTKENVTVHNVRLYPGMGPDLLEDILGGPGSQKGIGGRAWGLLNGVDDKEVGKAKPIPSQISIEDSYIRLDTLEEARKQLLTLSARLISRMHIDLTEEGDVGDQTSRRWLAHPRTLRLSTRPRPPLNPDGTRSRAFNRISRSCPLPSFVFNLSGNIDSLAEKLVSETTMPSFRRLHRERSGWNLSLINVAVTNMAETASETADGHGRDIGRMFRKQDEVLKDWKIADEPSSGSVTPVSLPDETSSSTIEEKDIDPNADKARNGTESMSESDNGWESGEDDSAPKQRCAKCNAIIPAFAMAAHKRFHLIPD